MGVGVGGQGLWVAGEGKVGQGSEGRGGGGHGSTAAGRRGGVIGLPWGRGAAGLRQAMVVLAQGGVQQVPGWLALPSLYLQAAPAPPFY